MEKRLSLLQDEEAAPITSGRLQLRAFSRSAARSRVERARGSLRRLLINLLMAFEVRRARALLQLVDLRLRDGLLGGRAGKGEDEEGGDEKRAHWKSST